MLKVEVGFWKRGRRWLYPCRMPIKIASSFSLSIRTRRNVTTRKLLLRFSLYFMPENLKGISPTFSFVTGKEVSYNRVTNILMPSSLF
jgi:hypothetical protein